MLPRIAIIDKDKCKPKKCKLECIRKCPINLQNKMCIEVTKESATALINEGMCIGCNQCVKFCPFNAIQIINLPKDLHHQVVHQYGPNQFRLHNLPIPRPNQILGLVGKNGIGKSTTLKILSGKLKPNLGQYKQILHWDEIINHFKGSELQKFLTMMVETKMIVKLKPQYVDQIPKAVQGCVGDILNQHQTNSNNIKNLDLDVILTRQVNQLSGGELQRFAIGMVVNQDANIYLFDEPSSFLDIKQRLNAAKTIRQLINNQDKYVIVVEHDLSILDYLSDYICLLWGEQGSYGVVSMPFNVREGINIFLSGYLPTENLRFRNESIHFNITDNINKEDLKKYNHYYYPSMTKTLEQFKLKVNEGSFTNSEIILCIGQNGSGKTTFIRLLSGHLNPDVTVEIPELKISIKPQTIKPTLDCHVRQLLFTKLGTSWQHPQFQSDVFKPLRIESLLDQHLNTLSGGELQRVALVLCLGKPADIYLIDEPSSYLDSEERIIVAKIIKRFIFNSKKTAFVVEHDFIMATYLADRVIVFSGTPSVDITATAPQTLVSGMNTFLKDMNITLRRDLENYRPRINKYKSQMDQEQKLNGCYFHNI